MDRTNRTTPYDTARYRGEVAWWDRFRRAGSRIPRRPSSARALSERLDQFVDHERGVEMYLEPATTLSPPSLVLVAYDGRWQRFTVIDTAPARDYARRRRIPCYDAGVVGYPRRMRDFKGRDATT